MKRAVAMVLLIAVAGFITGCGGSGSASVRSTHSARAAAASPTAVAAPEVTDQAGQTCSAFDSTGYCPGDDPVTCDTVLDPTGWANGPLTEVRAIAIAAAVADTDFTGIIAGTLSNSELRLLDDAAYEMKYGSGNRTGQLGNDSLQFASDEVSFNPGQTDFGPEDTAYSESLTKDIVVLVKDCPHAYKLGKQMANG